LLCVDPAIADPRYLSSCRIKSGMTCELSRSVGFSSVADMRQSIKGGRQASDFYD